MATDYGAQYVLLLAALSAGIGFGVICDAVRACRMVIKHCFITVFIEDLLVCIAYAFVMIIEFYNFSYGRPRLYAFISSGLAALAWRMTAGRLTERMTNKVMNVLKPIFAAIKRALKKAIDFLKTWVYTVYILNKAKHYGFTKEVG